MKPLLVQIIKFVIIEPIIAYKFVIIELSFQFLYLLYYQLHCRLNNNISYARHVLNG
jgi:hypothetical protein